MNTRKVFVEWLSEKAKSDPTIILIVADVGFSYIEDFAKEFPNQFINVGVTEQSMMGIAAGMALAGMKPYVYTMVPFVLMRPYEQVRNDIVYHNANVKLIGVRGSKHYAFLGFSHNVSDQDEKYLLKSLPELKSYWTETEENTKEVLEKTYRSGKAAYIRL